MKMELRFSQNKVEVDGDALIVTGYANKTNQLSEVLGGNKKFREKVLPGAFKRALERAKDVHLLLNHDDEKILSSTRNGSLKLEEDNTGLKFEARISPTSYGLDTYQLIKDGILTNMSFGMAVNDDKWVPSNGYYERSISDLDLFEISVVRDPAYTQTNINARSIELVEDVVPTEVTDMEEKLDLLLEQIQKLSEAVAALTPAQAEEVIDEVVDAIDDVKDVVDEVEQPVDETEDRAEEPVEEELTEEDKQLLEEVDKLLAEEDDNE